MKPRISKFVNTIAWIVIALTMTAVANAECGSLNKGSLQPQSFQLQTNGGSLLLISEHGSVDPIVGFWKVTFNAKGNPGGPNGIIDEAFVQWHSDGTEIMNSNRPPVTSSFCLGVWERVGPSHYKLNHFAKSCDTNNNPVGPANIREDVRLSHDGKTFTGTFTIDQYSDSGAPPMHIEGELAGTRITVDTTIDDVL